MCSAQFLLLLLIGVIKYNLVFGQLSKGDRCNLSSGDGNCRPLDRCQSVYEDFLSGKQPERACDNQNETLIVCCPNRPMDLERETAENSTKRRPADRMCAEYAKSVYGPVDPPILSAYERKLVNVSLCGLGSLGKLIVGGTTAESKEFPHMAAIGFQKDKEIVWECGGSLISDRYVLTAAHCLYSPDLGHAKWVRLGSTKLKQNYNKEQSQTLRIAKRIKHPNFKMPIKYNDIALLKLDTPVSFDEYVHPACLSLSETAIGEKTLASGWGVTDWFENKGSDDLLKVTLPIVSYENCSKHYAGNINLPNGIVKNYQLCAGENGKDTCHGDSGGPLMLYNKKQKCMYDIIGVTSFGKICGSTAPGVYTKVYSYLSWIEEIVWPTLN